MEALLPRPRKCRLIRGLPPATFYKPQGVPMAELKGVVLSMEGLEALRLADGQGMDQQSAAALMDISPATFCRILAEARRIVARALTQGWAIRIEGGDFRFASPEDGPEPETSTPDPAGLCPRGRRRGGKGGGPGGGGGICR